MEADRSAGPDRTPTPPPSSRAAQLGPYLILDEIGRGGMGVVMRARDPALKREVAIKILRPESNAKAHRRMRFVREAQITGQLEHPGVVPVHFLGRNPTGQEFFAMKLVRGRTLEEVMAEKGSPGRARRLSIFERVCETVAFAHANRILHRDLKPANISVGAHGEVWVLDWGLAKHLDTAEDAPNADDVDDADEGAGAPPTAAGPSAARPTTRTGSTLKVTQAGRILGTPEYMAPEQAIGGPVDQRADVYALGALLYHLLVDTPPVVGKDTRDTIRQVAKGDIVDIRSRVGGARLPRELVAMVRCCLSLDAADRYASAKELLDDLRRHLAGEPVSVLPDDPLTRCRRLLVRHRRLATAIGVALAALCLTLTTAAVLVAGKERGRLAAVSEAQRADDLKRRAEGERDHEKVQRLQAELDAQRLAADQAAGARRRLAAFHPYSEAMDLVRRGQRLDRAVELAREALRLDADFVEGASLLGDVLRAQGRARDAGDAYGEADAISRRVAGRPLVKALLSAALCYENAGDMARSAAAYASVDAVADADPLAEVGRCLRDLRQFSYDAARGRADRVCRDAPHLWECHYARSRCYLTLRDDGVEERGLAQREAEASARRAVDLAPGEGLAQLQLALSLSDGAAILAAIDRAIALEPANGSFVVQRAMMRLALGDADGARADADAARRLEAAPIQLALLAVEEAVLAGDEPANFAAMARLKDQLAGWPKELMAWIYLGVALGKDEVMPSYQAMLARHATHPYLAMTSALIAERAGRIDEALAIALACRERHPYHAQAGLMVVVYQGATGAHEAALATGRAIP